MISVCTLRGHNLFWKYATVSNSKIIRKRFSEARNKYENSTFPVDNFEKNYALSYIHINPLQKVLLTVGSAYISLCNPMRADMIALLSETTGSSALKFMLHEMETSTEGVEILRSKPRINTRTVDIRKLQTLPEGTLGRAYLKFLKDNNVTPDSRLPVQFVDDVHLAYVLQRYREVHDLFHTVLGMPTNMLGEVTVKWVEALQTRLPMCAGGALFGSLRLAPKQRQNYVQYYLPWAIKTGTTCSFLMNVFFEQRWEQPLLELQAELNIAPLKLP